MPRHKEFDRTSALDRAMRLFWHRGYEATSVQDLCDHMGINRGSLYDTFGDKRTLFLAALEHYTQTNSFEVDLSNESLSGKEAIQRVFDDVVEDSVSDKERCGCLVANTIIELAPHDAEIAAISEANRDGYEAMFYELLARAKRDGDITEHQDLTLLARFLVNTLFGLRIVAKTTNDRAFLEGIVKTSLSVLR